MLVQFGNNWIQKIPEDLPVRGNFFIQLFPNWTACSPVKLTYTNLVRAASAVSAS